jgi:hypothetical protein
MRVFIILLALIGMLAAGSNLADLAVNTMSRPSSAMGNPMYHSYYEQDGTSFGKIGAMSYMLGRNGRAMSDGYHSFHPLPDGKWIGKTGALSYLLVNGQRVTPGFHSILARTDGYIATLGSYRFELKSDGRFVDPNAANNFRG